MENYLISDTDTKQIPSQAPLPKQRNKCHFADELVEKVRFSAEIILIHVPAYTRVRIIHPTKQKVSQAIKPKYRKAANTSSLIVQALAMRVLVDFPEEINRRVHSIFA